MDGDEKYISASENRIKTEGTLNGSMGITIGNVYSGLDGLKRWLFNHNSSSCTGGLAVIRVCFDKTQIDSNTVRIPSGSPHANDKIINDWASTGYHALTIVGYDDEIWCFDYNENNVYDAPDANTPLSQCEKGAFKVANSWGTDWGNQGYIWIPYSLMTSLLYTTNFTTRAYTCQATDILTKTVFLSATVKHPKRDTITLCVGKGNNASFANPQGNTKSYYAFNRLYNDPGRLQMNGIQRNPQPIGLSLDFGEKFDPADCGKYFFQVVDNYQGPNYSSNEAYVTNFRLKDFRWGEVFVLDCDTDTVFISNNTTTTLAINYHLLPFDSAIDSSFPMATDRVARRTVTISDGTFSIGKGVKLDMYGTDNHDCELLFGSNASLVVGDSAVITAKRGDCRIQINGHVQIGQNVHFEAEDGASLEIVIDNGSDVSFNKTTFVNCDLTLPEKSVTLNSCQFQGTPVVIERNATGGNNTTTATVSCCIFKPNGKSIAKALYIKGYAQYSVENCIISNADLTGGFADGIYIHSSGTGNTKTINGNEISNCTGAGLIMYASAGNITMNHIYDNGYGVRLLNNSNIGQFSGDCSADLAIKTQYIHDNANKEVYMTGGCIPQTFRYNSIGDDDDVPFVYYDALIGFVYPPQRVSIDVAYNHWSPNFDSTTHLVTNSNLWYYVSSPQWVLGDCGPKTSNAENMIASADSLVSIGNHVSAKALYKQVIADYPTTVSAETALKSLLMIERYADNDYEGLKEYYQTHPAILGDESLSHMAFSLSNKCDEILENYEEAIGWYEGVLSDPETGFNDSIFAAIDLGDLYLRMEENGAKGVCGKLMEFIPESKEAHREQTQFALSLLPKEAEKDYVKQTHRELPDQYWTDIVTEQPEGYVVDANGDVHIYSAEAMAWVSVLSNGLHRKEADDFYGKTLYLEEDVDMSEAIWTPISGRYENPPFRGLFNGKGHVIEGLLLTFSEGFDRGGLFGRLFEATLTNTVLRNGYFYTLDSPEIGFLSSQVEKSSIDRCLVECEMHGGNNVPFVYSNIGSTITNSMVHCPILENLNGNNSGAFVAESRLYNTDQTSPVIQNCAAIIEKIDWSWGEMYGFVGNYNHGLIENCYAYIGEMTNFPGYSGNGGPRNGITRDNMGEVYYCYYNRIRDPYNPTGYLQVDDSPGEGGVFQDVSSFDREGEQWRLTNPITVGGVTPENLVDVLNLWVEGQSNSSDYLKWHLDISGAHHELPVFDGLGVNSIEENVLQISVQPNPTTGIFTITGENLKQIEVYDVLGQRITSLQANGDLTTIDLSSRQAGVYLVNITDPEGRRYVKRVVKN